MMRAPSVRMASSLGVIGCAASLLLAGLDPKAVLAGWLAGFVFWSAVPLGALLLHMMTRVIPGAWRDEIGPIYADRILDHLEARLIPGLRERLITRFHYTPADFAGDLNAHLGSAFSLEPLLTQSAFFRVHNRDDRIPNLYFVGAGTHPGAGIPGVVGSAKATAALMLDDLRRS